MSAKADADDAAPNTVLIRISPDQYRRTIADVFGGSIAVTGRFVEPGIRDDGLLAVGASRMSVTSAGLESADAMARDVAAQVFDAKYRAVVMPCQPRAEDAPDDHCAAEFIGTAGRLLFRRALSEDELRSHVQVANAAAEAAADFYAGLRVTLQNMLISPDFLFRREQSVADDDGVYRLTSYSRAARLSFFLWGATPDDELLKASESGALLTQEGLEKQVDRLMASPRLETGLRAFFVDMLGFDAFETLNKDTAIFPKFTAAITRDAQEQTLRTISDLLLHRNADYREIFTTRRTFLTPSLAALYGVPLMHDTENGAADPWIEYTYPEDDPRAGILTHASFVALHSHPGRSSPTSRGKALREHLLCQKVPPPPGDVDFSLVQDISNPEYKTARQRLSVHAAQPACSGCHAITDPIGLALENFDGGGSLRTHENGALIDTSGELNGARYENAAGLNSALHADPDVPLCLIKRVYAYAVHRAPLGMDLPTFERFSQIFAKEGYRIRPLIRAMATDEAMYRGPKPKRKLPPRPILAVDSTATDQLSARTETGSEEFAR